jgi:cyclic pyranopterin phosphate synthase
MPGVMAGVGTGEAERQAMSELRDAFGRRIDYLRVSVTDRCNLRCVYCLPRAGVRWQPRAELLTLPELVRMIEAAAALGIRRVRLTGGEPLVRPDLVELVRAIAGLPGIEEVSLTTNGMLLERLAGPLAEAGLARVNISLDTLDPAKFHRLTRWGDISRVWRGLAAAERHGLTPLKLNTVVVRGLNDDELPALARLTLDRPWHVRFIELMPVGNDGDWGEGFPPEAERYFSLSEMRARLAPLGLIAADGPVGNGPARTFQLPGALGTVAFISPLGEHFCAACNRLRLTADGRLRPCLLHADEVAARETLRAGQDVSGLILDAIARKPAEHGLGLPGWHAPANRAMCQIGG